MFGRLLACSAATAVAALVVAVPPAPAGAQALGPAAGRVILVTVDGTALGDWRASGLTTFGSLLSGGAVGLLSTRTTAAAGEEWTVLRASAYATLGAGDRVRALPGRVRVSGGVAEPPGRLGAALTRAGRFATAVGNASGSADLDGPALRAVMDAQGEAAVAPGVKVVVGAAAPRSWRLADPRFPTGARTDFRALEASVVAAQSYGARFIVVDTGDAARVERALGQDPVARERWMSLTMRRIDAFIGAVRRGMGATDALIVASVVPPRARLDGGVHLGAVVASGPGLRRGLLRTESTRRAGLVTLADLSATALEQLRVQPPDGMVGRAVTLEPSTEAVREIGALDRDLTLAARARHPVTRSVLAGAAAIIALALATVWWGAGGPVRAGATPRGWRDLLSTLLVGVAAMPLALLAVPLLPVHSAATIGGSAAAMAAGLALVLRVALSRERAMAAVLLATAVAALADAAAGSPLGSRSTISFLPAAGARFWGIGNELMGVVVAGGTLGFAMTMDRMRHPLRLLPGAAAALAASVVVMGAPALGGKFGAAVTAVPAFGVFLVLALGVPFDRRAALGIGIAVVLVTALVIVADAARSPETQAHIGGVVSGRTEIGPLVARKLEAAWHLVTRTIWTGAIFYFAGAVALVAWRRRSIFARALWGRIALRAAMWGCLAGAVAATAFNDAGLIGAALIAMLGAAAVFVVLLAPE